MPIAHPYDVDATGRTATPADTATWIAEVVEMVLFTAPGERVMRPTLGTGIHQLVFAPASSEVAAATQHLVVGSLQQWLSEWIEVTDVSVDGHDNQITVHVSYILRSTREAARTSFVREL